MACTVEVGGCGDTCGKLLECGIHECAERCHKGKCGTVSVFVLFSTSLNVLYKSCHCFLSQCWQMRVQSCRCGLKKKELPCYKEFQCETKCKHIKDCRRHPCNRKVIFWNILNEGKWLYKLFLLKFSAAPVLALRAIRFATGHLDAKTTSARVGVIKALATRVIWQLTLVALAVEPRSQFLAGARNIRNLPSVRFLARETLHWFRLS